MQQDPDQPHTVPLQQKGLCDGAMPHLTTAQSVHVAFETACISQYVLTEAESIRRGLGILDCDPRNRKTRRELVGGGDPQNKEEGASAHVSASLCAWESDRGLIFLILLKCSV